MASRIKADGDVWRPVLNESAGCCNLVFFCDSNGQRPYRVVVIEGGMTDDDLATLSDDSLRALFERSGSMGASQP